MEKQERTKRVEGDNSIKSSKHRFCCLCLQQAIVSNSKHTTSEKKSTNTQKDETNPSFLLHSS